jgi:hypothetical protein
MCLRISIPRDSQTVDVICVVCSLCVRLDTPKLESIHAWVSMSLPKTCMAPGSMVHAHIVGIHLHIIAAKKTHVVQTFKRGMFGGVEAQCAVSLSAEELWCGHGRTGQQVALQGTFTALKTKVIGLEGTK